MSVAYKLATQGVLGSDLFAGFAGADQHCQTLATRHGAGGSVMTISTGCTSGLDAVGHAAQLIEDGVADVMIAGAADAPISPITVACFDAIKATSTRNDEPERASRPFDANLPCTRHLICWGR